METIGIFIGEFNKHWDEHTVANGMGGSETWAIEVGKQFAAKGYNVIMYAFPEEEHDVVPNFRLKKTSTFFEEVIKMKYDYFIYSRVTYPITPYLNCNNVYMMIHDVCMVTPPNLDSYIGLGKIKAYCYLSEWHKNYLLGLYNKYGLTDKILYRVSNGFSREHYPETPNLDNRENFILWSSSITRGFDIFYKWVFLPLLFEYPDLKLKVCCGTQMDLDKAILANVRLLPGVEVLGTLPKKELAELQQKTKIWVYPGIFPETFCITAVENGYAGNVIISPLSYGLESTLGQIGYLKATNLPILSKESADLYKNSIRNILSDDELRKRCAIDCHNICAQYSWERTADEFINLFNQTKQ